MPRKAKFKGMDKNDCGRLRIEVDEALAKLGESLGLRFEPLGRMQYNPNDGTAKFRVECVVADQDGLPTESKERREFLKHCERYGFEESDLDRVFDDPMDRGKYKIVGLNPRARKNNILVERQDNGKVYVMPASAVLRCLGKPGATAGLRQILEG